MITNQLKLFSLQFFFFIAPLVAQSDSIGIDLDSLALRNNEKLDWVEKIYEQDFVGDEENFYQMEDFEMVRMDLESRKKNPLNLNSVSRTQLEQFPFLTLFQIEHILKYISMHGNMESIYELQLVEGMDYETIQYLLPYVKVESMDSSFQLPSVKKIGRYGKHEITTRFDIPFYKREGYRTIDDETLAENPNKQYLGPPWYHVFRYSFHYKDQIYAGITAEKDAGEPFFEKHNRKGYDSYSFYLLAQDLGKINAIVIGKYRVTFGQGLVVGSEYSFGKGSSVSMVRNQSKGFKKHSSTDEYNYFRGLGSTFSFRKNLFFSIFYSHRALDGIADNSTLTSINTTGKHTIPREVERKNAAILQTTGTHVSYNWTNFQLGMTGIGYFFDKYYDPQYRAYNHYYFRGKKGYNLGIDYKLYYRNVGYTGELALDDHGNTAMIHSIQYYLNSNYQFVALSRFYDKKYRAFHARSMSEGGIVQNENGIYLGAETRPIKHLRFNSYIDYFKFPYLKYLVDEPSSGFDGWLQLIYQSSSSFTMSGSYRYKQKDKNYTDTETKEKSVQHYVTESVKFQTNYLIQKDCLWKTILQWRAAGFANFSKSNGFSVTQSLSYQSKNYPLQYNLNYIIFDTEDYNSRVYAYEKGMLYSFYVPSYYGKGNRFSLSIRYDFSSRLMIMAKYGQTVYSDRDQIGSGLEAIDSHRKADLNFQIRWKF